MSHNIEHEQVTIRRGPRSGLTLIIAVHSRSLGPAAGGCRLRRYPDWRDGLADALRLSEAMTYKCAVAGLRFGGAKSVIALDEDTVLTPALREAALEDMGEFIASYDGGYLAGPDVGTGPADMVALRRHSPYAFCLPEEHGGAGSSSGPTARGVWASLRAGARHVFGSASVAGRTAVVSGYGAVGSLLAERLADAGARVLVSDVDSAKRDAALARGHAWVEPDTALTTPADILAPAAVGGVFSPETVPTLRAPLVVGPANNQLTDDAVADTLAAYGITWVPDFVASAGGVVYVLGREVDALDHDAATSRVDEIGTTVSRLLENARAHGTTPLHEAYALAAARISPRGRVSAAGARDHSVS